MAISTVTAIPIMTSNTTPSGIASASSADASFPAYLAFNGVFNATGWRGLGATNQWLRYDFPISKAIAKYSIATWVPTRSVKSWTFEGSNDGTIWEVLDTRINITTWVAGVKQEFIIDSTKVKSYKMYRINCSVNNGDASYTDISELEMFEWLYSNKFLISSEDKYYSVTQYPESDDIIPALTGNVTAIGNVIRSDENASYPAWQAFDKKAITSDHQFAWISATMMSGWIGFDFSIPIIIDRYSITGRADSAYTMSPKDWTFEGSNDGTNWTVLDTRRNVIDWNTTQTRSFIIGNKAKYKMYRINAVNNNSSNGVLIKEIKMGCSNQGAYLKNVKLNNAETAYLSHGMSKSESIGLDISFSTRIFVNPTSITLGSGKVFKQKIDTAKIPIKKASIT